MSKSVLIDLFVEDRAHEELLKPLINRVGEEEQVQVQVSVRTARGGHARAISEFILYQHTAEAGRLTGSPADLVVVGIDGNCSTFAKKRDEIQSVATPIFINRLIVACPDPHVERWYLADPQSFNSVVGDLPKVGTKKCERGHYKQILADSIRRAGHPPTLGGIEFASELAATMHLYRAGKNSVSLRAFLDDLRAKLRGFSASYTGHGIVDDNGR
jgi:hypothetical protein